MFQTWVSLVAFYVALKMGWAVLAPVVVEYRGAIFVATALYFLACWTGRTLAVRHFGRSRTPVSLWLRDSSVFSALMAYLALGFLAGGGYLVTTHHASLALLFAVLGLWLIGSMLGIGSRERSQREV
jgi:hypothetical protein